VVERPRVSNIRLCTHLYWSLLVDKKIETGWGHLGRSVEHSEWKDGESVVSIRCFYRVKGCHIWGLPAESIRRMYVD
jgi:hypothetical protein